MRRGYRLGPASAMGSCDNAHCTASFATALNFAVWRLNSVASPQA
jgi:hypothetical protein